MLQIHHSIVSIVHNIKLGNFQSASKKLDKLHSLVEAMSKTEYQTGTIFVVVISNIGSVLQLDATGEHVCQHISLVCHLQSPSGEH